MAKKNLNYEYRPSKNIERKILIEILREIFGVSGCKKHTYIGFGALFFTDFKLIHKHLGVNSMISIEGIDRNKKRYLFNRPFSSIMLELGMSNDVLPELDWRGKKIIWLDYISSLNDEILEDIEITFSNLEEQSIYMLSCNATFQNFANLEAFFNAYPSAPPETKLEQVVSSKETPNIIRSILLNKIEAIINARNVGKLKNEQLVFKQLIFLRYRDGAPMFSFGGVLVKKSSKHILNVIRQLKMPFVKKEGENYLNIESPLITNKEVSLMNSILPKSRNQFLNSKKIDFIPTDTKEAYFEFYKYHPSYFEVID